MLVSSFFVGWVLMQFTEFQSSVILKCTGVELTYLEASLCWNMSVVVASKDLNEAKSWFAHLKVFVVVVSFVLFRLFPPLTSLPNEGYYLMCCS